MDDSAFYFLKIIEADQERQRQGLRSCFEELEDNVLEMSETCPHEEGGSHERHQMD